MTITYNLVPRQIGTSTMVRNLLNTFPENLVSLIDTTKTKIKLVPEKYSILIIEHNESTISQIRKLDQLIQQAAILKYQHVIIYSSSSVIIVKEIVEFLQKNPESRNLHTWTSDLLFLSILEKFELESKDIEVMIDSIMSDPKTKFNFLDYQFLRTNNLIDSKQLSIRLEKIPELIQILGVRGVRSQYLIDLSDTNFKNLELQKLGYELDDDSTKPWNYRRV